MSKVLQSASETFRKDSLLLSKAKVLFVSGADAAYGGMLADCVSSLRRVGYEGDIAIIDFGISRQNREVLARKGAQLHQLGMPEIYQQMITSGALVGPPGANVLLLKPYLPMLFPSYQTFVFVDADCWFQTGEAVNALIEYASHADIAAV